MQSTSGTGARRGTFARFFMCMCVLATTAFTQPASAQVDDVTRVALALNTPGNGENEALLRRWMAALVSDPSLVELSALALNTYGNELSDYERSVLQLIPYLAQNANQLLFNSIDDAKNSPAFTEFSNTVLANAAVQAALAEGQRTLDDSAAFYQRVNETRSALNSHTSQTPPPQLPAQSCGAPPSDLITNSTNALNSYEWSHTAGLVDNGLTDPAIYDFARLVGPGFTAALRPQDNLSLVDANGNPLPVFNLGKLVKGIVKAAAATVVCVAAVVVAVASAGSTAVVVGAVATAVVSGLYAVGEGVTQIIDASMQGSACAADAPLCTAAQPCAGGVCSIGCCVAPEVAAQNAALVRAKLVACASDAECPFNTHCQDGCCYDIEPD